MPPACPSLPSNSFRSPHVSFEIGNGLRMASWNGSLTPQMTPAFKIILLPPPPFLGWPAAFAGFTFSFCASFAITGLYHVYQLYDLDLISRSCYRHVIKLNMQKNLRCGDALHILGRGWWPRSGFVVHQDGGSRRGDACLRRRGDTEGGVGWKRRRAFCTHPG